MQVRNTPLQADTAFFIQESSTWTSSNFKNPIHLKCIWAMFKIKHVSSHLFSPSYVASDVTLCKLLNLSKPHFPFLENGDYIMIPSLWAWVKIK